MTNAPGFNFNQREERMGGSATKFAASIDINRDFPYNQASPKDCLQTIASRVIFRLFAENLFVSSITFHGGTNSITYAWGSYNHLSSKDRSVSAEAPDNVALSMQALQMVHAAGPTF